MVMLADVRFLACFRFAANLDLVFQKVLLLLLFLLRPDKSYCGMVHKRSSNELSKRATLNFQWTGFSSEDDLSLKTSVFNGHLHLHLSLTLMANFIASTVMQVARSLLRNTASTKQKLKITGGTSLQGFKGI